MAITPVDYSSRSYAEIRDDLIAAIPTLIPEWTSRSPSDFGMVLIEMFSYVGDGLHYYIDRVANEAFLSTAVQRASVLALARMLDYRPTGRTAASVTLSITASASNSGSITVLAKSQIATAASPTQDAVIFETDADLTLAPGVTSTVTATQGVSKAEDSTSPVGISTGQVDQEFTLFYSPVIENSLTVYVDEDGAGPLATAAWRFVAHLIDAATDEKVYTTFVDEDEVVHVLFGDGANGKVPTIGAVITATYRTGGGIVGNVGAGTVTQPIQALSGVSGVTNASPATGGSDPETLDSIRRNAPRSLTVLQRAVTLADYATLSRQVAGVSHAAAAATVPTNVTVYVAPVGGGNPSTAMQNAVLNFLSDKMMIGTAVTVANPAYVPINVTVNPLNVLPQYNRSDVNRAVQSAIAALFNLDNVDFGFRVTLSMVYKAIQNVDGVDYAVVTVLSRTGSGLGDVVLAANEIPTAGTITTTATGGLLGT